MAKGNDGNLLQHCIEVELALALSEGGALHVVSTHGMAPFETLDGTTSAYKLFEYWLRQSGLHYPLEGLPGVIAAYRSVGASKSRYPNSIELLRGALGASRLSGVVCEVVQAKAEVLAERLRHPDWQGTSLAVRHGSWRPAMKSGLPTVTSSWLMTMDPMQYKPGAVIDDESIYRDDLVLVRDTVKPLLDGPYSGALAVFSYSMTPEVRAEFETALNEVFGAGAVTFIGTTARGGNKHVAAIVSNQPAAVEAASRAWTALNERGELATHG